MIPDYLKFARMQDKKFIPFLYMISVALLGLYWKNAGYTLGEQDVVYLSGILALILFSVIYELKAYWTYKCVVGNIDFSFFAGKKLRRHEALITHPAGISVLFFCVAYLLIDTLFSLVTPLVAQLVLCASMPPIIYVIFRALRNSYIKQVQTAAVKQVKYPHLSSYVMYHAVHTLGLTLLTIAPLKKHADFSLQEGFLSARLMIATLMLCAIVLLINLLFMRLSRRYIFLGRLFLQEINLYFSSSLPWQRFYLQPLWLRMMWLLLVETVWIITTGLLFTALEYQPGFVGWFLCCFIPCLGYYYLHLYWLWHNDFLMACDMYFRWGEIDKQYNLW